REMWRKGGVNRSRLPTRPGGPRRESRHQGRRKSGAAKHRPLHHLQLVNLTFDRAGTGRRCRAAISSTSPGSSVDERGRLSGQNEAKESSLILLKPPAAPSCQRPRRSPPEG